MGIKIHGNNWLQAMKKYISFFALAVLITAVFSCQISIVEEDSGIPEEVLPQEELVLQTYTATTGDVTKTSMDGSGNTVWAAGDQIKIYYTDATSGNVELSDGVNTKNGVFSGMVPAGKTGAYAVYPAAIASSVDIANNKVTVTVPEEQALDAETGGFTTGNIATSIVDAGNNLKFQNVNAFLSVTVSDAVTKVVVESVDGTTLASGVDVTYPADPADPITYSNSGTEYSSITLLLPGEAGTYYFSVVPGTHAKGLKFTYYTGSGSYTETGTYYLNKSLTIARNDNWQFGSFEPTKDYYVKDSGSGGNGLSWSSAFNPTQMWNMITLAAAGSDDDKKVALFDAIDGATFHLGAGDYNFGAAASLAVSEASTLNLTFMGGYPADGGARDVENNATIFTGDDDADGTGDHRILILDGNMSIVFDGITFTKGLTKGSSEARFGGGVLIKSGSHSFVDCTFTHNSAETSGKNKGYGGAIRFDSTGKLTLTGTTFSYNTATGDSGALSLSAGTTEITDCSFSNNSAPSGGAIDCFGSSELSIGDSNFSYNTASSAGGAVAMEDDATCSITATQFDHNSANTGGAISISGGGDLKIKRSYFYRNDAYTGGAVYTVKVGEKYATVFVDECSFENNWIRGRFGCIFNMNGFAKFCMYNSSAKDSYTKSADPDYLKGLNPSWIAVDPDGGEGCVSFGNCSIIGDTWDGNNDAALSDGTALIAVWGSQTNYFTNCIIAPETAPGIAAIKGAGGSEKIDLYYTHYSSIINTAAPIDSGGNSTGLEKSSFDGINWSSSKHCWRWDGTISSATPTMATKDGVYGRIYTICSDFVDSDFSKDQCGTDRGNGDWWPGAYQN
jgi:predicted outer membrane repeat protein